MDLLPIYYFLSSDMINESKSSLAEKSSVRLLFVCLPFQPGDFERFDKFDRRNVERYNDGRTNKGGLVMEIQYIRMGDYFIPDLKLPEENRPIGKWGRMHREYLKEYHPIQYTNLILSCELWSYLADLNEQVQQRMEVLVTQMKEAEGITETMKASHPVSWVQHMNNIHARAEEIIREEMIYT